MLTAARTAHLHAMAHGCKQFADGVHFPNDPAQNTKSNSAKHLNPATLPL
jgi:hypothetical protein